MKQKEFYSCLHKDGLFYKIKRQGYSKTYIDYTGTEITLNCYKYGVLWVVVEEKTGYSAVAPQKKRDDAFSLTFSALNEYAKHHNKSISYMLKDMKNVNEYKEYKGENENE